VFIRVGCLVKNKRPISIDIVKSKQRYMDYKKNKIDISYPLELIENRNSFPQKHVIPCSVLVDNEEIGGIFIVCPSQEIKYFKILPSSPPEPPLKFRMLDYKRRIFVVEIWMQFSQNPEKYLKMHLNPHDKYVQKLLKLGSKTNMISFHFYDTGSHLLSSAITNFNDEETDWFDRNYKLSTKLISDQRGYKSIAEYLSDKVSSTDRIFKYFNQSKSDFFVREGGKQVMLHEISKLN